MALNLFGQKPAAPPKTAGGAGGSGDVVEVTDASFMKDVIEESRTRPVVIDFWAPWCGPCRQLTPSLEKAVTAKKGAVRLAKINIDENPAIAQQFRVQSIPAVFVIDQGKAFQGFMGALPDSQVKAFIDDLAKGAPGPAEGPPDEITPDEIVAMAAEALAAGDAGAAAQAFAQVLQIEPDNLKAVAGLARCYLTLGEPDRAADIAAMAPADSKEPEIVSLRAALALAAEPQSDEAPLEQRLAADPDDHEARFELAKALAAKGKLQEASDHLLDLMARDRGWNEDAARKQLLLLFEAAGFASEVARNGRKRLSSLLFA